jgi:hypothetical protein
MPKKGSRQFAAPGELDKRVLWYWENNCLIQSNELPFSDNKGLLGGAKGLVFPGGNVAFRPVFGPAGLEGATAESEKERQGAILTVCQYS